MIICEEISKEFSSGERFLAVNHVSLNIKKGEFVALCGHSGSGKSTLLNMIGLIDRCTTGRIIIDGQDTSELSAGELARVRNEKIGYIFQAFYLEPHYSVARNIEVPLLIANMPKKEREQRIDSCLEQVGLLHKKKQRAGELSGGEQQRVCIARALANSPQIILADEPCGNLDSHNTAKIMGLLKELHQQGITILMVTHSNEDALVAERIVRLKDGEIIES